MSRWHFGNVYKNQVESLIAVGLFAQLQLLDNDLNKQLALNCIM